MNRYWDKTEKERSELTRDQVEAFLTVELMEKGVVRVDPPKIEDLPDVDVEKKVVYRVGYDWRYSGKEYFDVVFSDAESAQRLAELKPMKCDYDYNIGSQWKYAVPCGGLCVESTELYEHSSVLNVKSTLARRAEISKANESALSEYRTAAKAVDDAVAGVWADYYSCVKRSAKLTKIRDTFTEYLGMCDGNEAMARQFLLKAFSASDVTDAEAWFGESFGSVANATEPGSTE